MMTMSVPKIPLHQALSSFNRKERNLLVRAIAGLDDHEIGLRESFRAALTQELGLPNEISESAWWATDFHISWLAGALSLYREQGHDPKIRPNSPHGGSRSIGRLVESNQEDVDLVVVDGSDLILIEAKAYGSWNEVQFTSKLDRLHLLVAEDQNARGQHNGVPPIRIHLVLMSPSKPPPAFARIWPEWARQEETIPWVELPISGSVFSVRRSDVDAGNDDIQSNWRIVAHKAKKIADA